MRIRYIQAFGSLCQETCVILYWLGLWSLINLTFLVRNIPFCIFCLLGGGIGIFVVNAFAPALILRSIEESSIIGNNYIPSPRKFTNSMKEIQRTIAVKA